MNKEEKYFQTQNTWNKLAQDYQEKFMDLELYDESYDAFCDALARKDASILEIGCGPGNITRYISSRLREANILGIDTSGNMIALAKKNVPRAEFRVMDARSIPELKRTFDAIIIGFCVPYLDEEDCRELIRNAASLLNKNGLIYLSFIEGDNNHSAIETGSTGDSVRVYYYTLNFFKELMRKNSIGSTQVIRIHYQKSNGKEEVHLVVMGRR